MGSVNATPVIEAVSRPARTFTGDFYLVHRDGSRQWIVQGDVAGKGLPAAVVMAMIQEELERRIASCARTMCDPAATVQRLHEFLLPLMPSNRFATAVVAVLDDDGTLRIANAGHTPPLIVRSGDAIDQIASTGPVMGLLPNASWHSLTTRLEPGETLVLYSDGVIEAIAGEDELGVEGLRMRLAGTRDPRALLETLRMCDDATVLMVRR
jgi:sigma-B regulation protein RsbU (phosphoserine phosphatase)